MNDMEFISKDAALACFTDWIDRYGHEHTADEMVEYQRIEDLPVADVVEVVRCKDCIYGDPDPSTSSEIFCEKHCRWLSKDHYCADGKRREPHD